uniref:hypothetical protein n=1 Tax=Actinotignum timonense TaxID=1870995 RepID=UPI002A83B472
DGAGLPAPGVLAVPGARVARAEASGCGCGDVGEEFSEFLGVFLPVIGRGETVFTFLAIPTLTALFCEAFLL